MWSKFFFFLLFFILIGYSIGQRIKNLKNKNRIKDIAEISVSSFFSEALANLLAVAGGIYISLSLLVAFLEIELPNKVSIVGISMEPLALIALILAIIQPFLKALLQSIKAK